MNLSSLFPVNEKVLAVNTTVLGISYIITNKADYKYFLGKLQKFNKGILAEGQKRWEEVR